MNCALRRRKSGGLAARLPSTTGMLTCGWNTIYLVYPALPGQKPVKKATLVVKKRHRSQLARVSNLKYGETVWSDVFPGNYHTVHCLQPAVLSSEIALDLAPEHHSRIVYRLDGGAGSETEMQWLVERGYHILAKGINNNRANKLAQQVQRWDPFGKDWLGEVAPPITYARPVRVLVRRENEEHGYHYSYFVTTLAFSSKKTFQTLYNARGGAEVEQFREDKSGLSLEARRKRSFLGQKAYILLNDLAHNLLSDFTHRGLANSRFETFGTKRIVRDLLNTPGRVTFEAGQLKRIDLLSQKQISEELLRCLNQYLLAD